MRHKLIIPKKRKRTILSYYIQQKYAKHYCLKCQSSNENNKYNLCGYKNQFFCLHRNNTVVGNLALYYYFG